MVDAFNPNRLTLARRREHLTISGLVTKSGVSRRTLTNLETGTVEQPEGDTVERLSAALSVPPSFFYAPDAPEVPPGAVSFRAASKLTARSRDAALAADSIALDFNRWVESRFRLPAPDVPTLPSLHPEAAAHVTRARWGLGAGRIPNMVQLLEAHGVRVFSLARDCAQVDAFSLYDGSTPVVFLNTAKSPERSRFDAAHELGHLVLHAEHGHLQGRAAELDANRFSAAFLMPQESVVAAGLRNASAAAIIAAKKKWGVAAMALTHRLHELNLLTDWGYRTACIDLSRMGYRSSEPHSDMAGREASQILAKVFAASRVDNVRPSAIAADLHISQAELSKHVFGLVPVAVEGELRRTAARRGHLQVAE